MLAGFTRHTNTVFLTAFITVEFIAISAIDFAPSKIGKQTMGIILMLLLLLISPVKRVYSFVHGDIVKESVAVRAQYETVSAKK